MQEKIANVFESCSMYDTVRGRNIYIYVLIHIHIYILFLLYYTYSSSKETRCTVNSNASFLNYIQNKTANFYVTQHIESIIAVLCMIIYCRNSFELSVCRNCFTRFMLHRKMHIQICRENISAQSRSFNGLPIRWDFRWQDA